MEKIDGTPDAIYYNYPHANHRSRKWGMTLFNRKERGSRFYDDPSQPPSNHVRGSGKASDNMTRINIASWERFFFFLLSQT